MTVQRAWGPGGAACAEPVCAMDLYPTLAEIVTYPAESIVEQMRRS